MLSESVQSTKRREAELIASQAFSCLKVQKCVAAQLSQEDPRRLFRLEGWSIKNGIQRIWQAAVIGVERLQCLLSALFPPEAENANLSGKGGIRWFYNAFPRTEPPSDERKVEGRLQSLNESLLAAS